MNKDVLYEILSYIDNHICEKVSLSELADMAGYSPFYFSKLFTETMGMPVTGYIRIRKLQYAVCSLLEGKKVLDVSLMYAFESHEGFTRSFSQLFGSSPSTVRKYLTSYRVPEYYVPNTNKRRKISDNGRGIPLSEDLHMDKKVLDKILAGHPISNLEYAGMGDFAKSNMQTVNSLCESLQVNVYRNGTWFQQDYVRGIAQHEIISSSSEHASGTEISLKPDTCIFGDKVFSVEIIKAWITDHCNREIRPKVIIENFL